MNPRRITSAGVLIALGTLLTGCDSTRTASSSSNGPAAAADSATANASSAGTTSSSIASMKAAEPAPGAAAPAAAAAAAAPTGKSARAASNLGIPAAALSGRSLIYTAEETIQVADVSRAVSAVEAAVAGAGGLVAKSERSGGGEAPSPPASANLTLRIPPGSFSSFLDRVGKAGDVTDRTLTGNDVTDQVVDVASRIDTARRSVDRVRALMEKAVNLRDVVSLEGELSSREGDLEALLAKQNKLKDQTDLATVTLHLDTKPAPVPVVPPQRHEGFRAGLDDGWGAFTGALVGGATVLGAVLPFALVFALLGPPLVYAASRVRRHRADVS